VARAGAPSTVPRTILVFIIVSDDILLMVKYQKITDPAVICWLYYPPDLEPPDHLVKV
jgi:hypothetical protein